MKNKRVFLISSGLLNPKKEDNYLNRRGLYPNYGLVSLATILKEKGYSPVIIHGDYEEPTVALNLMTDYGVAACDIPILLSIPSFFSLTWVQKFCKELRKKFYGKKIIVGGKWVVCGNETWIKAKIPEIDYVVSGNAENIIEKLITFSKPNIPSEFRFPTHLDYTIVHDFEKYQPSVEVARGCGQGCSFCLEKDSPYSLISTTENIVHSLLRHQSDYQSKYIKPYFQASFFKPSLNWCETFSSCFHKYNLTTQWRTQTRVDCITSEKIEILAKSGLKVLDLGLESASIQQLIAMGKSKKPEIYLDKASELLKKCYENGIWTKVNILFYPGENFNTINETFNWLISHKKYIKGISVNPLTIYRYSGAREFIRSLDKFGASQICENSLDELGYAHLNLSSTIDFNEANNMSIEIRKKIVTDKDYFDLKSFSYFDRFYSFDDFREDINNMSETILPFRKTTGEVKDANSFYRSKLDRENNHCKNVS